MGVLYGGCQWSRAIVADFSQSCKFTVALACVFFHLSPVIGVSWWGIWIVGGLGGEVVVVAFFSPFCVLVRLCPSAFLYDYKVQSAEASHRRRGLKRARLWQRLMF
jgi:hypothetical protein